MREEQNHSGTRRRISFPEETVPQSTTGRRKLRAPSSATMRMSTAQAPTSYNYDYDPDQSMAYDLRVDPHDQADAGNGSRRAYVPDTGQGTKGARTGSKSDAPRSKAREALSWVISIGLAVVAALLIRAFLFEIILVDGQSMEPTLHTDERIGIEKVTRYTSLPERGDIIIVNYPNMEGTYVKRAIGLPGETVEVRDSTVYIDGVPLEEDYISSEPFADMDPVVVPEDHVFVMGDNRAHSMDSRAAYIGPISKDAIIGHGLFVLWPLSNMHMISHASTN